MIEIIHLLGIFIAVLVNITALTLLSLRAVPFPATARASGIVIICLALFSLEHFVGLNNPYWLCLPVTALSLCIIWYDRAWFLDETFKTSEIVFLCAVLYGLGWRLAYPDIVEDNDRLSDFHLVANYLSGERLPPLDYWLPYQRLDYYYTFQHYSAALLGRIFGWGPGTSYNMAAVILAALVLSLAWEFLSILGVRLILKLLALGALAIGGTGISPLFHIITTIGFLDHDQVLHSVSYSSRFLGWFETSVTSDFWRTLFGEPTQRSVLLPIETFGYQYAIGGYHATLSGFLLLFLALTIMVAVSHASRAVRARLETVLGLTIPLTLCSNAWVFPLQAALVVTWKIWDQLSFGHREWRDLAVGAVLGLLLLLNFLGGLGAATKHLQFQLVSADARAPITQFLILYWPLILVAVAIPLVGLTRSLAGFLAALFIGLLVVTELFNAYDGIYAGQLIRFNPALKWWGWIFTGGVFSISAFLLASKRHAGRLVAVIVLILISTFAYDSGRLLAYRALRSSVFPGKFDGSGFYAREVQNARMMQYLADAPRGIVLENIYDQPPEDTGIYGSFAQKPSLVGIPWVLQVWRRDLTELPGLVAEIKSFYAGSHAQAARFLADCDVRYIIWSPRESKGLDKWQSIMQSIDKDFRWMEFSRAPDSHIGLWIRR